MGPRASDWPAPPTPDLSLSLASTSVLYSDKAQIAALPRLAPSKASSPSLPRNVMLNSGVSISLRLQKPLRLSRFLLFQPLRFLPVSPQLSPISLPPLSVCVGYISLTVHGKLHMDDWDFWTDPCRAQSPRSGFHFQWYHGNGATVPIPRCSMLEESIKQKSRTEHLLTLPFSGDVFPSPPSKLRYLV